MTRSIWVLPIPCRNLDLPLGVNSSVSAAVRDENSGQPATGNIAVLYSQYELADFGLKNARINDAIANADAAEADLQRFSYEMEVEVGKLYFSLLKNQFKLSADWKHKTVSRYLLCYKKKFFLSGIRPGSDTSLSKAELSKAIINYNQTLGGYQFIETTVSLLVRYRCETNSNGYIGSAFVRP